MYDHVSYMRQIAIKYKAIAHTGVEKRFYRMSSIRDLEELLVGLSSARLPALGAIDTTDGRVFKGLGKINERHLHIFVVFGLAKDDLDDSRELVNKELLQIKTDILSRIYNDHLTDCRMDTSNGLQEFDIGSVSYRFVGPLPARLVALMVSFSVDRHLNLDLRNNEWGD